MKTTILSCDLPSSAHPGTVPSAAGRLLNLALKGVARVGGRRLVRITGWALVAAGSVSLHAAVIQAIDNSVMVSATGTAVEEMIPVVADSPENAVWTPLPEPVFDHRGEPCVATLTGGAQQFIQWVPGNQFIDNFDPPKPPYASRGDWVPGFYNSADSDRWGLTVSNGVLRVTTLALPPDGRLPLRPPGPYLQMRDFYASADILDLRALHANALMGIAARVGGDPGAWPGNNNGYIASVAPNARGANLATIQLFPGSLPTTASATFTFKPGTRYRLIFSGVGHQFSVQLIDLESGQPAVEPLVVTNSRFSQGAVAFWIQSGGSAAYDVTLDNFFVTGTKP